MQRQNSSNQVIIHFQEDENHRKVSMNEQYQNLSTEYLDSNIQAVVANYNNSASREPMAEKQTNNITSSATAMMSNSSKVVGGENNVLKQFENNFRTLSGRQSQTKCLGKSRHARVNSYSTVNLHEKGRNILGLKLYKQGGRAAIKTEKSSKGFQMTDNIKKEVVGVAGNSTQNCPRVKEKTVKSLQRRQSLKSPEPFVILDMQRSIDDVDKSTVSNLRNNYSLDEFTNSVVQRVISVGEQPLNHITQDLQHGSQTQRAGQTIQNKQKQILQGKKSPLGQQQLHSIRMFKTLSNNNNHQTCAVGGVNSQLGPKKESFAVPSSKALRSAYQQQQQKVQAQRLDSFAHLSQAQTQLTKRQKAKANSKMFKVYNVHSQFASSSIRSSVTPRESTHAQNRQHLVRKKEDSSESWCKHKNQINQEEAGKVISSPKNALKIQHQQNMLVRLSPKILKHRPASSNTTAALIQSKICGATQKNSSNLGSVANTASNKRSHQFASSLFASGSQTQRRSHRHLATQMTVHGSETSSSNNMLMYMRKAHVGKSSLLPYAVTTGRKSSESNNPTNATRKNSKVKTYRQQNLNQAHQPSAQMSSNSCVKLPIADIISRSCSNDSNEQHDSSSNASYDDSMNEQNGVNEEAGKETANMLSLLSNTQSQMSAGPASGIKFVVENQILQQQMQSSQDSNQGFSLEIPSQQQVMIDSNQDNANEMPTMGAQPMNQSSSHLKRVFYPIPNQLSSKGALVDCGYMSARVHQPMDMKVLSIQQSNFNQQQHQLARSYNSLQQQGRAASIATSQYQPEHMQCFGQVKQPSILISSPSIQHSFEDQPYRKIESQNQNNLIVVNHQHLHPQQDAPKVPKLNFLNLFKQPNLTQQQKQIPVSSTKSNTQGYIKVENFDQAANNKSTQRGKIHNMSGCLQKRSNKNTCIDLSNKTIDSQQNQNSSYNNNLQIVNNSLQMEEKHSEYFPTMQSKYNKQALRKIKNQKLIQNVAAAHDSHNSAGVIKLDHTNPAQIYMQPLGSAKARQNPLFFDPNPMIPEHKNVAISGFQHQFASAISFNEPQQNTYYTQRNNSRLTGSSMLKVGNNISSQNEVLNGGTLGNATNRLSQESESEIEVFNIINQFSQTQTTFESEVDILDENQQSLSIRRSIVEKKNQLENASNNKSGKYQLVNDITPLQNSDMVISTVNQPQFLQVQKICTMTKQRNENNNIDKVSELIADEGVVKPMLVPVTLIGDVRVSKDTDQQQSLQLNQHSSEVRNYQNGTFMISPKDDDQQFDSHQQIQIQIQTDNDTISPIDYKNVDLNQNQQLKKVQVPSFAAQTKFQRNDTEQDHMDNIISEAVLQPLKRLLSPIMAENSMPNQGLRSTKNAKNNNLKDSMSQQADDHFKLDNDDNAIVSPIKPTEEDEITTMYQKKIEAVQIEKTLHKEFVKEEKEQEVVESHKQQIRETTEGTFEEISLRQIVLDHDERTPFKNKDVNNKIISYNITPDKQTKFNAAQRKSPLISTLPKTSKNPKQKFAQTSTKAYGKENPMIKQKSMNKGGRISQHKSLKKKLDFTFKTPPPKLFDPVLQTTLNDNDNNNFNEVKAFPIYIDNTDNLEEVTMTISQSIGCGLVPNARDEIGAEDTTFYKDQSSRRVIKKTSTANNNKSNSGSFARKVQSQAKSQRTLKEIMRSGGGTGKNCQPSRLVSNNSRRLSYVDVKRQQTQLFGMPNEYKSTTSAKGQVVTDDRKQDYFQSPNSLLNQQQHHRTSSFVQQENNDNRPGRFSVDRKMQCCSPLGRLLAGGRSHSQKGTGSIQQITPINQQSQQQNNFNNLVPQLKINLESTFFKDATTTAVQNNNATPQLNKLARNEAAELVKCKESLLKSEKSNTRLMQENAELRKMLNFMLQQKLI